MNAVLATVIRKPFHFSFLHQLPSSLLPVNGDGQQQPTVLASLDLFLANLRSHLLLPDANTYQLSMGVAASVGEWQRVLHWWRDMEQRGLQPTLTIAHHVMAAMKETHQPALIKPSTSATSLLPHRSHYHHHTAGRPHTAGQPPSHTAHLPLPALRCHPAA